MVMGIRKTCIPSFSASSLVISALESHINAIFFMESLLKRHYNISTKKFNKSIYKT